jgi:type IV secretion system protein VirD4
MKKKIKTFDIFFYGTLIILAALAGAVVGHLLSLSIVDGEIDYMVFLQKFGAIDFDGVKTGLKSLSSSDNRYQLYGLGGGAGFAIIMIMYFSGTKKRYHHKGEEYGSARWATKSEIKTLADINDNDNNVIIASNVYLVKDRGQRERNMPSAKFKAEILSLRPVVAAVKFRDEFKDKLKKISLRPVVAEEKDVDEKTIKVNFDTPQKITITTMLSLNTMIFGGTGCGKSRFYVKPNLLQCNCSFVITDPSGELLMSCGNMLKRHGYKIKVFNLMDLDNSNNYNPFHYVDYSNSQTMQEDIKKIVTVFMACTKDVNGNNSASGGDPFWDSAAEALLSAACYLLAEDFPPEERSLSKALEIISLEKCEEGKESELSLFDGLFLERKEAAPNSTCLKYYTQYKQGGAKTKMSILATLNARLKDFNMDLVCDLTGSENIELETIGDEKTALFIIIPTTDGKYNWLASMMYTQLFDSLYRRAQKKYAYRGGRLPVHVRFILDEFANTGKIPEFEKALATIRKYEISATIILQNLTQLKNMYEKSYSDLIGNCDTKIFLGGEDLETNKYFVELLGKETIDTLSINKTKAKQGSTSYNDGILGRDLMTADELGSLPNAECIVKIRGYKPIRTRKHELYYHPRYKELAMEKHSTADMAFDINSVHTERTIRVTETLAEATDEMVETLNISFVDNDYPVENSAVDDVFLSEIFNGKQAVYTTYPPAA